MLFLENVFHWSFCEFILSGILFLNYKVFSHFVKNASDRYSYLRISFAALLTMPFLPIQNLWTVQKLAHPQCAYHFGQSYLDKIAHTNFEIFNGWSLLPAIVGGTYLVWVIWKILSFVFAFMEIKTIYRGAKEAPGSFRWPVFLTERKNLSPMTVGIFKPKVILPKNMLESLSKEELRMVLEHEFAHADRRDGFFNLLRVLVKDLLKFSPFAAELSRAYEENMEISIDMKVLALPEIKTRDYAELILRLNEEFQSFAFNFSATHISKNFVKRRILSMKNPKTPSHSRLLGAALVLFMAFSAVGDSFLSTNAVAHADDFHIYTRAHRLSLGNALSATDCKNNGHCVMVFGDVIIPIDTSRTDCSCKSWLQLHGFDKAAARIPN